MAGEAGPKEFLLKTQNLTNLFFEYFPYNLYQALSWVEEEMTSECDKQRSRLRRRRLSSF